jgi:molybdate/tungstate transport system permease protein
MKVFRGIRMTSKNMIPIDSCLISFWLVGGLLVALVVLAAATIAIPELLNPGHLLSVARESDVIDAIAVTFGAGFLAVFILILLGTPLAYLLARGKSRWNGIIETIVDLPLALPHTVAGLMIYLLFMMRGPLGMPFQDIGIIFEDAFAGIVVAMIFVSAPYYIDTVREGIAQVPERLEHVARTLGASRFRAIQTITLPLSMRSIISGTFLAWGRAIGEFAAVVMIAYFPMVVSTLIYHRFTTGGLAESRSITFLMMIACILVFLAFRLASHGWGRRHDRS